MKFLVFALATSLFVVACNKQETAAPEAAPAAAVTEGHDKEHHHVVEGVDHQHEETHHAEHDHAAHHPNHDEEMANGHEH